jgi:hypothetical protein
MSKQPVQPKPAPISPDEMVLCKTCGTLVHKNKATLVKDEKNKTEYYTCGQE